MAREGAPVAFGAMKLKIKEIRESRGISQEKMAELLGISPGLYSMLERQKRRMNETYLDGIAAILGTRVTDLIDEGGQPIAVAGEVGAGSRIELNDAYLKGAGLFHVACPSGMNPHGIVAVVVRGDSMEPMYFDGDVVFYSRATDQGILSEDIGRPCIVCDEDGNVWLKQVKRGADVGLFNLISLNPRSETMWNQRISWASKVKMHLPSELVEVVSA